MIVKKRSSKKTVSRKKLRSKKGGLFGFGKSSNNNEITFSFTYSNTEGTIENNPTE